MKLASSSVSTLQREVLAAWQQLSADFAASLELELVSTMDSYAMAAEGIQEVNEEMNEFNEAYNNTIAHLRKSDSIAVWKYDPNTGEIEYSGAPFSPVNVLHRVNATGGN